MANEGTIFSNLVFSSNIYPVNGFVSSDRTFIGKINDYSKLKSLYNKYFNYPNCDTLSKLQTEIIKNGTKCSFAHNDPCWGVIIKDQQHIWACKCINERCQLFTRCRKDYDVNEYYLFSPEVNNCSCDYFYRNVEGQQVNYYKIEYISHVSYNAANLQNLTKPTSLTKVNDYPDIPTNVLNAAEISESERLSQDEDEDIDIDIDITIDEVGNLPDVSIFVTGCGDKDSENNETNELEVPNNIFADFLPADQKEIINAAVNENYFIDAGPGTGKTYTLIEKINYLVSEMEIDPESIQILSFTNAAVNEIKSRLNEFVKAGGDRGLRNVDIRTFHSMAWWLLGQANEFLIESGWKPIELNSSNMDYEESIKRAADLIKMFPDIVSGWKHFIVDEVQDLTGNKARFVLTLIEACMKEGCGFSVFGDSCQAIYDYVKKEEREVITSVEFYSMLYRLTYRKCKLARFEVNHRQTDNLIELSKELRSSILDQSQEKMAEAVRTMNQRIPLLEKRALLLEKQDIDELSNGKTLCFLCRNNGQTLKLSTLMRKRQIPHALNVNETTENFASWIAQVFIDYTDSTITLEKFSRIITNKCLGIQGYTVSEVWERIRKLLGSKSEVVDVAKLLCSIRTSKIEDSLFRVVSGSNIIVSNIHRAKGREYSRVILDNSFIKGLENDGRDTGEYKTLYVAVTRPKEQINTCEMNFDRMKSAATTNGGSKRWYTTKYNKKLHIEVGLDNDVLKFDFIRGDNNYHRQKYIAQSIRQGDTIKLRRKFVGNNVEYDILHCINDNETVIGKMSSYFMKDLNRIIRPRHLVDYPAYIEDLFVDSVYTHIESSSFETYFPDVAQISKFCVWNWVGFSGMGHLIYDTY